MPVIIALAGNPNSGKTTMFNDLTGSSQYVGNWPGVTVEKKEGKLKGNKEVIIQDLPGIYSLSPYTPEEVVTRNYLLKEGPDAILNIVDATNIERNLYLTLQLIELGIPVTVALNMYDLIRKNGDSIDTAKLSSLLDCAVVETSALKGIGSAESVEKALLSAEEAKTGKTKASPIAFSEKVERVLTSVSGLLPEEIPEAKRRWYAIKLFERDEKITAELSPALSDPFTLEKVLLAAEEELDDDGESIITKERYDRIAGIMKACVRRNRKDSELSTSDRIDRIVTNRWLALPIFAIVMFLVYYISVSTVGTWATDWTNDVFFGELLAGNVSAFLAASGTAGWLNSLLVDGVIGGVGAVLGFLPQMLVLFFCLAILEDSGYMARVAFLMDRIFRKFGLSGKSFIPMLVATGCGVPGIMASRTIENESDRKITIMTATFMPCGAKLPIIALIAGALFPESTLIAPGAYFIGIAAVLVSGILLKKTSAFSGDPAPFVMELPAYHLPKAKGVFIHMWDRGKSFVKKAGTLIFLACLIIWFLSSFDWTLAQVGTEDSILASIGKAVAPLFAPLGWGNWKAAVAAITGLLAKENVVGTFGVLYGFGSVAENGVEVWSALRNAFTPLAGFSFLLFNLLCAPCFAAIGAIHREMGGARGTWFAIGYQTGFAYAISLIVYQFGTFVTGGEAGIPTVVAALLLAALLFLLLRPAGRAGCVRGKFKKAELQKG